MREVAKTTRTPPNTTLPDKCIEAGLRARLMWEIAGPKNSRIAWLSCYAIGHSIAIVETYAGNNGWSVMTPPKSMGIEDAVKDTIARCN